MAKTVFSDGVPPAKGTRVLAAFLNAIFGHVHDGVDADGHAPKVELDHINGLSGMQIGYSHISLSTRVNCESPATPIPWDDTAPQSSEGVLVHDGSTGLVLNYAAKRSTSKLLITVHLFGADTTQHRQIAALFQSGSTNALVATSRIDMHSAASADTPSPLVLCAEFLPGTTASITYSVRASGGEINGSAGAHYLGTAMRSSLTIQEIAV